ncbi:hypothetical protein H072_9658 [Dactylellina haptotyla CBS 200.50]|uniref:Proteophosphoglycan ppg4 n=1 Tax=Dactylellina haptotyla (strain CBS 200.50) TaxID=1284197 RepID=S8A187_DACHA|nr:hypothetical protein H072_9658 [Dactylellina haptotyla CBS 200.50]
MNAWSFAFMLSPPGPATAVAAGITRGTAASVVLRPSLVPRPSARCWWGTRTAAVAPSALTRPLSTSTSTSPYLPSLPSLPALSSSSSSSSTGRRRIATGVAVSYRATSRLCGSLPSGSFFPRQQPTVGFTRVVASLRQLSTSSRRTTTATTNKANPSALPQNDSSSSPSPSPSPLPLPNAASPNEPKLKILYSAVEDKARRAPPPDPPRGSFQHYRNWVFRTTGPEYAEKTAWTWFKWHAWGAFRVFIFVGFALANIFAFAFGCVTWYIERQEPTPSIFTEWARTSLHVIYWYTNLKPDLPLAGVWARDLMDTLEKQMEKLGGWDKCTIEWKRQYVATSFKVAKLLASVAKDEDAYVIYRRILAMEPDVVDAKRRSQAALGMANCAVTLGLTDEVTELLQQAIRSALEATPEGERFNVDIAKPVLPEPQKGVNPPSSELLGAIQALGVQYARLEKPAESLPIFLSLLRTLQSLPDKQRDNCREASIMAYIGEVIWAIGKRAEGLAWTKKAMEEAERDVEKRDTCRSCAIYAVANAITMTDEMGVGKGKTAADVQQELSALKSRQDWLDMLPRRDAE